MDDFENPKVRKLRGLPPEDKETPRVAIKLSPDTSVRLTTIMRNLRKLGHVATAERIEEHHKLCPTKCETHGEIKDPVIGLLNNQVAFFCPWCSGSDVLARWEAEGNAS